jgi:hypothetical protein
MAACPTVWEMGTKELKNILYWTRAAKAEQKPKNLLYWHNKPNKPTKEGPLLFVLFEFPFTSVSTVSRNHPSLVSLMRTLLCKGCTSCVKTTEVFQVKTTKISQLTLYRAAVQGSH